MNLLASMRYLVAQEDAGAGPRNWRLDRIFDAEVTGRAGDRPEDFSLQAYADDAVNALRRAKGDLARMALDAGLVTGLEGRYKVQERLARIKEQEEAAAAARPAHWSERIAQAEALDATAELP